MAWALVASADSPTAGAFTFDPLDFTGFVIAQIALIGLTVTTDATNILLTFYVGGAEIVTGYRWGHATDIAGGAAAADSDTSDTVIVLHSNGAGRNVGNAAGEGFDAIVTVDDPIGTSLHKRARIAAALATTSGALVSQYGVGLMPNTGAIDGIKVAGSSNLTAGKVRILGWA